MPLVSGSEHPRVHALITPPETDTLSSEGLPTMLVTLGYFILAVTVLVWLLSLAARLCIHITWRNSGNGEDYRYRAMREKHGRAFAWKSLFTVFLLQDFLIWFISMPIQIAQDTLEAAQTGRWPSPGRSSSQ